MATFTLKMTKLSLLQKNITIFCLYNFNEGKMDMVKNMLSYLKEFFTQIPENKKIILNNHYMHEGYRIIRRKLYEESD